VAGCHRLRRLIPTQNLFWWNRMLDGVESSFGNSVGIPQQQPRR
jgi:hypothetical protein